MVRARIGHVFLHSCGHVWSARNDVPERCPGCDARLEKGEAVMVSKKMAVAMYKSAKAGN